MYHKEFSPNAALKPYIRCYFYIKAKSRMINFPADGCPGLIINTGDPFLLGFKNSNLKVFSGCRLFGSFTRQLLTKHTGQTDLVAGKFLPGQVTRFFKIPAIELTDTSTAIENPWGKLGRELEQKLCDSHTVSETIKLLDEAFLERLSSPYSYDDRISVVLHAISSRKGQVRIEDLARGLDLSRRHFELHFIDLVGLTPKRMCRITRFLNVFSYLKTCQGLDWADLAIAHGYSDQAHLIRECKFFTDHSLLAYLKNRSSLEHAVTGTKADIMSHFFNTTDVSSVTMPQTVTL